MKKKKAMTTKTLKTQQKQTKPEPKKIPAKSHVSSADLKAIKKELLTLRDQLTEQIERKKSQELTATSDMDPGDDGDMAMQTYEKEILFEISGSNRETLMNVEGALRKIEHGSYGICDRCQKPIPLKRIRVIPQSRYCLECQHVADSGGL